ARPLVFEGMATVLEYPRVTLVNVITLALERRPEITADLRTFIPVDLEPFQSFINSGRSLLCIARSIGIYGSQNQFAFVMASKKPVEQRRPSAADMQVACGRR